MGFVCFGVGFFLNSQLNLECVLDKNEDLSLSIWPIKVAIGAIYSNIESFYAFLKMDFCHLSFNCHRIGECGITTWTLDCANNGTLFGDQS